MVCSIENCTSCGCCQAVCPQQCISMKETVYGNRIPEIDTEKCVDCNLCRMRCPVLKEKIADKRIFPQVFMCQHYNEEVLDQSASGGAFSILSDYIFEREGVVFGAQWNEDFSVRFYEAHNHDEIVKMHGSKYVQSHLESDIYQKIKKYLEKDRWVLFCGLPCQCAAIQSYIGKEYDNFINVDIVCHGVAAPILLQKHITYLNTDETQITSINHTSKKNKWSILIQRTICYDKQDGSHVYLDRTEDFYLNNFLNHLFFNEACYQCKFASMPRNTDFTIGDFFGIGVLKKSAKLDHRGISMMMLNSVKAKEIYEKLYKFGQFEERELEEAMYFNHNLWKPSNRNSNTKNFWDDYLTKDWSMIEEKYHTNDIRQKANVFIRRCIKTLLGARVVCYLMFQFYCRKGYIRQADIIIKGLENMKEKVN